MLVYPAAAAERQKEVLFLTFSESSDAFAGAPNIADIVAERIEEWDVAVQQKTVEKGSDDLNARAASFCNGSNTLEGSTLGCFWISTSKGEFTIHLLFFSEPSTWSMERKVDTDEKAILAETAAMVVKSTIAALPRQSDAEPNPQRRTDDSSWPVDDTELIPAAMGIPDQTEPLFPLPLLVSGGYSLALTARDMDPSQGIEAEISFFPSEKVSVFASYVGNWLSTHKADLFWLRVRLHPVHLGLRVVFVKGRAALLPGAAVGFIPTEYKISHPKINANNKALTYQMTYQWSFSPGIRGAIRIAKWLCLYLGISVDILLHYPAYTYGNDYSMTNRISVDTRFVMPRFQVGISFGRTGLNTTWKK